MRTLPPLLAVVAGGAALVWHCAAGAAELPSPPPEPPIHRVLPALDGEAPRSAARAWSLRHTPVVDVVRRARAAVVNIHSERTAQGPAHEEMLALTPSQSRVNGMGTGIVIDGRGYVLTNQHVVEDVQLLRVRLDDGTTCGARVLQRDREADLALLKIDAGRTLPTLPLGTSGDLLVGETVVAIGNAYGYEHTVSVGVVSAIGRDVRLNREISYKALIQTDASINPGNSGGPLLNVQGELVGVNVAIRAGAQGIGFAIPVDAVVRVAARMLAAAAPVEAGLRLRDEVHAVRSDDKTAADDERRPGAGLCSSAVAGPAVREVIVEGVESGGAAARAGLRSGDVLVRVGDQPVQGSLDLSRALLGRNPGEHLAVAFRRREGTSWSEKRADLVVEARRAAATPADAVWRRLGVHLREVGRDAFHATTPGLRGGMTVTEVRPDSAADKAGLRGGDVLIGLHNFEMLSLDNVLFVLDHPDLAAMQPLRFYIIRAGQVHRGWLQPAD